MSANTYLDKLRRTLPNTQGKQFLRSLIAKKDSGEIKTLDEFKTKLKELTTDLLANRLKPTFKVWEAIAGEEISSETYNDMLKNIHNDLEAAFDEANNLDDLIEAHHQLIEHISLSALRLGLNQLDSQISLYEFIEKNKYGFDDSLYNTFRGSDPGNTTRTDEAASLLFVDPRTLEIVDSLEDARIDSLGEKLLLGSETITYLTPKSATQLTGLTSSRSELNVQYENSNINNIIDGLKNTYWAIPILKSSINPNGVTVEIQINLNASQDVNFIEIEPACYFPMVLTSIYYISANQQRVLAFSPDLEISGPTSINFNRVTTKSIILVFRQDNYSEVQFKQRLGEVNFYKALLGTTTKGIDLNAAQNDLNDSLSSFFLKEDILHLPASVDPQKKFYEYTIGLDNIRLGFNVYLERSIFVSKRKVVSKPGVVALKVTETRPLQPSSTNVVATTTNTYPSRTTANDEIFHHGIVEYWAVIQSLDLNQQLIAIDYVPIFPIGAYRVYHEKVIFTKKSASTYLNNNSGSLVFYTLTDPTDVIVHKNGTRLIYSTDWDFVSDTDLTETSPNAATRMKRGIKVIADPSLLDIYTVSYTPTISNTQVVPSNTTLLGVVSAAPYSSIRMVKDNVLMINKIRGSYTVDSINIYLLVVMRRNSANANVSPALEDYLLAVGSVDNEKYLKDY